MARIRPRFSLRTLLVLVMLAGCCLGWQARIAHQRKAAAQWLRSHPRARNIVVCVGDERRGTVLATKRSQEPALLRLFGDCSCPAGLWMFDDWISDADLQSVKATFPEAEVKIIPASINGHAEYSTDLQDVTKYR